MAEQSVRQTQKKKTQLKHLPCGPELLSGEVVELDFNIKEAAFTSHLILIVNVDFSTISSCVHEQLASLTLYHYSVTLVFMGAKVRLLASGY